jgi:hypothetical protein
MCRTTFGCFVEDVVSVTSAAMPERDTQSGHSARLLRGLVWAGVVLAPIAAAVVLVGGDASSARFAVLLMAVSVVLIGASVLIRADPVLLRMDVEDRVAEEVDGLRRQLRAEFASAAPAVPEEDPRPPLPVRNTGGRAQVTPAPPAFTSPPGRPTFVHQPEPVVQPRPQHEPEPEYQYDEVGYRYDDQSTGYDDQTAGYDDQSAGYPQEGYQQEGYQDGYQESYQGDGYQDGYPGDGYQDDGYQDGYPGDGYQDDGYPDEDYQQPVPARGSGGRASVPGIVQPVSPAPSQGFAAQGSVSQGFAAQGTVSQGFAAQGTVSQGFAAQGVSAGRASAAVPVGSAVVPGAGATPVARASAAAAVPPPPIGQPVPRPRAAASVPGGRPPGAMPPGAMPPGAMPPGPNGMIAPPLARAAAAARPGGTQYGRPEAPDDDFGATDGYAGGDPDTSAEYKARRHRPSANDTNVGTLADFANYPGYSSQENW